MGAIELIGTAKAVPFQNRAFQKLLQHAVKLCLYKATTYAESA
jgi:hypothetical protein